jgi:hypothetical protein
MVKQHVLAESDSEEPRPAPAKHKRLRRSNASEDDSGTNSEAILSDASAKAASEDAPSEPPKKKAARKRPAVRGVSERSGAEPDATPKKPSSRGTGRSTSARAALHAKHLSAYADQTVLRIKPDAELSAQARVMFRDLATHLMRRLTKEAFSAQVNSGKKILHSGTMAAAVHLVAPNRMLAKVATDCAALRICASGKPEREGLVRAVADMQC